MAERLLDVGFLSSERPKWWQKKEKLGGRKARYVDTVGGPDIANTFKKEDGFEVRDVKIFPSRLVENFGWTKKRRVGYKVKNSEEEVVVYQDSDMVLLHNPYAPAKVTDIFKRVDLDKDPEHAIDEAWHAVRHNIAFLASGGQENITPVPYITDSKSYCLHTILLKRSGTHKAKIAMLNSASTSDVENAATWTVCEPYCPNDNSLEANAFRSREMKRFLASDLKDVDYEHWNDYRNDIVKEITVFIRTPKVIDEILQCDTAHAHYHIRQKGLDHTKVSKAYVISSVVFAAEIRMLVRQRNNKTGEKKKKELTYKGTGPDPDGFPVAFFCDKYQVTENGHFGDLLPSNPNICRTGIFKFLRDE